MRLLSAVHPTTSQKRVLAKIAAAPTPTVAGEEISKDANLVAARNMLMKLGVISFADGEAILTDRGTQIAADENIVGQDGQLTPAGEKLAFTNTAGQPDADHAGQPSQQPVDDGMSLESFSLLKQLLR